MTRLVHWSKYLGFVVMALALSGCLASMGGKKAKIPVMNASGLPATYKYFDVIGKYDDSGLTPFNSMSGLSASLANKAAADGATVFVETKRYEKYTRAAISGIYAYVEGVGIKWKPADEKTLLSDLKAVANKQIRLSEIQLNQLTFLVNRKKIKKAAPLLRQAMPNLRLSDSSWRGVSQAYIALADASENVHLVKLVNHRNRHVHSTAIFALSKNGTKKHAPVFLKLIKNNKDAYTAAKGLKRVAGNKYRAEWEKLFKHHTDWNVRLIAAEALLSQNQRTVVEQEARNTSDRRLQTSLNKLLIN